MTRRTLFAWLLCLPAALLTIDATLGLRSLQGSARLAAGLVAIVLLFVGLLAGTRGATEPEQPPWDARRRTALVLLFPIFFFGGNYLFGLGLFPGHDKQLGVLVPMVSVGIILLMKTRA